MQHITAYDALGLVGAAMFIVSFAGNQLEKLDPHGLPSLLLNFVGAVLILVSLAFAFNLASFVLESIWGLIALFGLAKLALRRRRG